MPRVTRHFSAPYFRVRSTMHALSSAIVLWQVSLQIFGNNRPAVPRHGRPADRHGSGTAFELGERERDDPGWHPSNRHVGITPRPKTTQCSGPDRHDEDKPHFSPLPCSGQRSRPPPVSTRAKPTYTRADVPNLESLPSPNPFPDRGNTHRGEGESDKGSSSVFRLSATGAALAQKHRIGPDEAASKSSKGTA